MQPINQAQRRSAFLNFLLLFVITLAVIMVVIFFSIQVPFAENKKMKDQLNAFKENKAFEKKFSSAMTDPQTLLRQANVSDPSFASTSNQVGGLLTQLDKLRTSSQDSSISGSDNIYYKTLQALYDLKVAKDNLANAGQQTADVTKLQEQINNLNNRINSANAIITTLSQKLNINPPLQ